MTKPRVLDKRSLAALAWPIIAVALSGLAPPAFSKGNQCLFQARGLSMSFGTLDPSSGATVTVPVVAATLDANKVGDCAAGQQMVISGDDGLNFSGTRRMKHDGRAEYIPYSLSLPSAAVGGPGNGSYVVFTFSGTVTGSAYADVWAGTYSDTVVITVTP